MDETVEVISGDDGKDIADSLADPACFGLVARRHFDAIYRYIARRVGRQLADDLSGETFLVAFERRSTFDVDMADARPWLYGIATNLVRRQARSERRRWAAYGRLFQQQAGSEDPTETLVEHLAARQQAIRIAEVIARLNRDQRDALHLVVFERLSYEDAARALGIPVGTLRSRLARARQRLRELSADFGEVPSNTEHADRGRS